MFIKLGTLSLVAVISSLALADGAAPADATTLALQGSDAPKVINVTPKKKGKTPHVVQPRVTSLHSYTQFELRAKPLPIEIKYTSETSSQTNVIAAISRIDQGLNDVDMKSTFKAQPIYDEAYQTKVFSRTDSPYVSSGLYQKIAFNKSIDNKACEIGIVGPCTVIELDSASGEQKQSAYHVFTATDPNDNSKVRIYRIAIDEKKYAPEIQLVTEDLWSRGKGDGTYVYSSAPSAQEAQDLDKNSVAAVASQPVDPNSLPIEHSAFFVTSKGVHFEGVSDTDERKRELYGLDTQNFISAHTQTASTPIYGKAPFNTCWVVANMVPQRYVFGVDFKSIPNMWRKVKSYSRVSKGATLTCYLLDGKTRQDIPVVVREHGTFIFGLVGSKASQKTLSWGLAGFLNSANEALTMHDYVFPIRASAGFGPFQGALTPLVLSNQAGHDAIVATAPEATVFNGFAANADVTLFGGLTIQADMPMPQGRYN